MLALTVAPGKANSARLEEMPEPAVSEGALLVRARAVGVCGTDAEIIAGQYGWAPAGADRRLVARHCMFSWAQRRSGFVARHYMFSKVQQQRS